MLVCLFFGKISYIPNTAIFSSGKTNPAYRLYVYDGAKWVDNGIFTSIAAGIVQETGDNENVVMSQKAVTEKLSELASVKAQFGYWMDSAYASFSIDTKENTFSIKGKPYLFVGNSGVYLDDASCPLFGDDTSTTLHLIVFNKTEKTISPKSALNKLKNDDVILVMLKAKMMSSGLVFSYIGNILRCYCWFILSIFCCKHFCYITTTTSARIITCSC